MHQPESTPRGRAMTSGRLDHDDPVERISPRSVTAVLVAITIFLYLVRSILLPFVISAIVAYICRPLVDRLARRLGGRRWAAASLVFVAILALAAGLLYLAVPPLVGQVMDLLDSFQQTIERGAIGLLGPGPVNVLGQHTDATQIAKQAVGGLRAALADTTLVPQLVAAAAGGGLFLILSIVLLFYFLASGPEIAASLVWCVPPRQRPFVRTVWRKLDPILIRYFCGIGIIVTYAIVAAYLGLGLFLHLQNALILAVVTGVCEMVPVFGPAASAVIAGLFALRAANGFGAIAAFAVYMAALRLSVDQVLAPVVFGRAGRVSPVLIIFCFLAGGLLFGVVGIILAIPTGLTIKTVLETLYDDPEA